MKAYKKTKNETLERELKSQMKLDKEETKKKLEEVKLDKGETMAVVNVVPRHK